MQSIEAARGVAALMVVLMHGANLMNVPHFSGHIGLGGLFNFGYVGVDFFFVLSGFIISYVHFGDIGRPERIGIYLWRRFSRIFPIFWVCLSIATAVAIGGRAVLGKGLSLGLSPVDIVGTVFLIPVAEPQILGVAWSLQYEVMFYVLFVVLLLSRRLGTAFLVLWAAAILVRLSGLAFGSFDFLLSSHSLQFIMGVAVGMASRQGFVLPRAGRAMLGLAVLGFAVAVLLERSVFTHHGDAGRIALGLASAAALLCLIAMERAGGLRVPAFLYRLGSVSYSVYLAHIIFISVIYSVLLKAGLYHRLPEVLVYLTAVVGALAISMTLGLWVELPLVARLKPWVEKR